MKETFSIFANLQVFNLKKSSFRNVHWNVQNRIILRISDYNNVKFKSFVFIPEISTEMLS